MIYNNGFIMYTIKKAKLKEIMKQMLNKDVANNRKNKLDLIVVCLIEVVS